MPTDSEHLEPILALMARYKVVRLRQGELELEMSPLGWHIEADTSPAPPKVGAENGNPTDEELLLWSAGGPLPDIKAGPPTEPGGMAP